MGLIRNLADHDHLSTTSARANQPADDRLVIVQDKKDHRVVTRGARYVNGRWLEEETGEDFTDQLSEFAIWFETELFFPACAGTEDQEAMEITPVRKPGMQEVSVYPDPPVPEERELTAEEQAMVERLAQNPAEAMLFLATAAAMESDRQWLNAIASAPKDGNLSLVGIEAVPEGMQTRSLSGPSYEGRSDLGACGLLMAPADQARHPMDPLLLPHEVKDGFTIHRKGNKS